MKVNDLRIVRASDKLMNKLASELRDVTAGHVVPGHVFAADLHVGGQKRLRTVADSPRNIWLNKYDVPYKQVLCSHTLITSDAAIHWLQQNVFMSKI